MRPLALLIVLALIPLKILGVFGKTLSMYVYHQGMIKVHSGFESFETS